MSHHASGGENGAEAGAHAHDPALDLEHIAVPRVVLVPDAHGPGATPRTERTYLPRRVAVAPAAPPPVGSTAAHAAMSIPHILDGVLSHLDTSTLLTIRSLSSSLLAAAAAHLAPHLLFMRDGAKLAIVSPRGRVPALPVSEYLEWDGSNWAESMGTPATVGIVRNAALALQPTSLLDTLGDVSRPASRIARGLVRVRCVRYAPDAAGRYTTRLALPHARTAVVYAAACAPGDLSAASVVLGASVRRLVVCPAGAAALPELSSGGGGGGALSDVVVRLSDLEDGYAPEDIGERRAWLARVVADLRRLAPLARLSVVDLGAVKASFWGYKRMAPAGVRAHLRHDVLAPAVAGVESIRWLSSDEYAAEVGSAQVALETAPWCGGR
ncbi:uncharacterized protein LOC62_05G007077 [Vanrija pseudolonga]|uniref:Uncharacterized protein n=1 Tax=Vanrija pseudolonga TaxID=143232 RepID=A0AAF0YGR4_9TREE|nr:hypothetical protein LOC62_05G007077 [Vanrija pseudolonga]